MECRILLNSHPTDKSIYWTHYVCSCNNWKKNLADYFHFRCCRKSKFLPFLFLSLFLQIEKKRIFCFFPCNAKKAFKVQRKKMKKSNYKGKDLTSEFHLFHILFHLTKNIKIFHFINQICHHLSLGYGTRLHKIAPVEKEIYFIYLN